MNEELEWMGGAGHSHPTPARGQWDSGSQGKVGDVGNASETAINPSVAAGNAGITGRQGWSLLLLGKHLSIIVCGWESGGGEQRCSLAERSFPPAGPGSSLRLSCSRDGLFQLGTRASFIFPMKKQGWI